MNFTLHTLIKRLWWGDCTFTIVFFSLVLGVSYEWRCGRLQLSAAVELLCLDPPRAPQVVAQERRALVTRRRAWLRRLLRPGAAPATAALPATVLAVRSVRRCTAAWEARRGGAARGARGRPLSPGAKAFLAASDRWERLPLVRGATEAD